MTGRSHGVRRRTRQVLDAIAPGDWPFDIHVYLTEDAGDEVRRVAAALGITMGGLVAMLIEGARTRGGAGGLGAEAMELLLRAPNPARFHNGDHHVGV